MGACKPVNVGVYSVGYLVNVSECNINYVKSFCMVTFIRAIISAKYRKTAGTAGAVGTALKAMNGMALLKINATSLVECRFVFFNCR